MARINNTSKYQKDQNVTLNDSLIGTDEDSLSRETKNFPISSIIRLLSDINGGASNNFTFQVGSTIPQSGSFTTNDDETSFVDITNIKISKFNSDGIDVESFFGFILENRDIYSLTLEQQGNLDVIAFIDIDSFSDNQDYFNINVSINESKSTGELISGNLFNFKIDLKSSSQPLNKKDFIFEFIRSDNPFLGSSITFPQIVNQDTRQLVSERGDIPRFIFKIYSTALRSLPKIYGFSLKGLQEGVFGVNGNRTIVLEDLLFEFERLPSSEEIIDDPSTQIINFPDITTPVEDWLNTTTPNITLQDEVDGLVIFRGNINSELSSFLFIGERLTYGNTSGNTAEDLDFEPLREGSVDVDLDPSKWERDESRKDIIKPKDNKRIDASIVDNLPEPDLTEFETTTELNVRDATNRDRANHTGTQNVSTITGLSTVATSGDYDDLTDKPLLAALALLNTVGTSEIDNEAITLSKLQNFTARSILGRPGSGNGSPSLITFGNGTVLYRDGSGNLVTGKIVESLLSTDLADKINESANKTPTKTAGTSYLFQDANSDTAPLFTSNSAVSAVIELGTTVGKRFLLSQWGDGEVTITGETGVTLRFPDDELAIPASKYSWIEIIIVDTNEAAIIGRLKQA